MTTTGNRAAAESPRVADRVERVAAALRREEPDRVPYCEEYVSRPFAERLMGWGRPSSLSLIHI